MKSPYTPYHPRWYRRRIPIFWWLSKRSYTKFIARELTSPFVAYAALLLLVHVWVILQGESAYDRFSDWLRQGPILVWHTVLLLVLLFHTFTWLNLAPKALVLHVGRRRLPAVVVLAGHYVAWVAVSAVVGWLILGGV